jgi:hypothetical protein
MKPTLSVDGDWRSSAEPSARTALDIVERIRPLLAGYHPAEQGGALADLLAMWLAGHPHELREALLSHHVERVRELVPVNVKAMGVFKR